MYRYLGHTQGGIVLRKVISGGQTGADIAGLEVAKKFGFETGGTMPFGFKTLDGPRPTYRKIYGLVAHRSSSYVPRTRANVRDSDGTIRLAFDFESRGEKCTLRAIRDYGKPFIDVDLSGKQSVEPVVQWLKEHNIEVLNVAGNAEQTWAGTHDAVFQFLESLFLTMSRHEHQVDETTRIVAGHNVSPISSYFVQKWTKWCEQSECDFEECDEDGFALCYSISTDCMQTTKPHPQYPDRRAWSQSELAQLLVNEGAPSEWSNAMLADDPF